MSVVGYLVAIGITLFLGSWAITWVIKNPEEPKDFERGYYEGYEQGLDEDYWTGWTDCRKYFKESPEKLEL